MYKNPLNLLQIWVKDEKKNKAAFVGTSGTTVNEYV